MQLAFLYVLLCLFCRQTKAATFEYYTQSVARLLTVLLLETYTWLAVVYIILT